jgi:hypothetical protein
MTAGRAVMGAAFRLFLLGRALAVLCVAAAGAVMRTTAALLLRRTLAVFCMTAGRAVMGAAVFVFTHKNQLLMIFSS